jgi:predicted ATPase
VADGSIARPAIVGREAELEQIRQLFELDGPAGLVIEGEAGIGKTTLWLHGVEEARRRWTVLVARPAEGETSLPFSALGDLLEPVLDSAVSGLPAPQRAALEAALLRVQPTEAYGRLAVSRAVLTLLRGVALREPTVLAVDDVQWLDPASADVLEFAVRRLGELPVRFLVARRSTQALPAPLGLGRALGPGRLEILRIGPLPIGDLDRLLRANLNLRLPRPRLIELHRRANGNPFYALEIARASARSRADDLLVPESLGALLRDRLAARRFVQPGHSDSRANCGRERRPR